MPHDLTEKLLEWFDRHGRQLPWRETRDPYAIWVAEVMLQQTRVEAVKPYYQRWMERFPTVRDLAAASQEDILNAWEGLGYYQRARNLHRAAQQLVELGDGRLPENESKLRALPGIGPYTSAAVAAIAFGQDTIALDGNLRRVLARLYDVDLAIQTSEAEATFRSKARQLLPPGRASEFNQALMDLGATICTPRSPACSNCPVQPMCLAFASDTQEERPVRQPRADRPHVSRAVAVIERRNAFLLGRRPEDRLLGGMWEFPGFEVDRPAELPDLLATTVEGSLGLNCTSFRPLEPIEHGYTHFRVTAHPYHCRWLSGEPSSQDHTQLQWAEVGDLPSLPMGRIDRLIAEALLPG